MTVKLSYFKHNGKWYTDAEYETNQTQLFEIWDEVSRMRDMGQLPGLIKGHSPFLVLVDAPDYPYRHLHIVGLS